MTVTYSAKVSTSSFGRFLKLLVRWRGSIYKLLWKDFLVFLFAYYALSFLYRFVLNERQRVTFENVAMYCDSFNNLIPVAFVLGFYVAVVLTRWWNQIMTIPWPDRIALFVTALIHGHDERGRLMRRTIMRYLCLSFTMTFSAVSPVVKKRFPTMVHIMDAGFMSKNELTILEDIETKHPKYFVPLVWATSLVTRARKENRIKDDFGVKTIIDEINQYRGNLGMIYMYDWINIPLVYTQVVTLAVYTFFLSCLMGRQFIQPKDIAEHRSGDFYIPIFTLLQFLFYMGWLKVAETLVNPLGEDDDDFEVNWVVDRNLQVSYLVVDGMHNEFPELIRDSYWNETDFKLPYTVAAEASMKSTVHMGSAVDIKIEPKLQEFVPLETIQEDGAPNDDNENKAEPGEEGVDKEHTPDGRPSPSPKFRLGSRFRKPWARTSRHDKGGQSPGPLRGSKRSLNVPPEDDTVRLRLMEDDSADERANSDRADDSSQRKDQSAEGLGATDDSADGLGTVDRSTDGLDPGSSQSCADRRKSSPSGADRRKSSQSGAERRKSNQSGADGRREDSVTVTDGDSDVFFNNEGNEDVSPSRGRKRFHRYEPDLTLDTSASQSGDIII